MWFGNIKLGSRVDLNSLVKVARKITAVNQTQPHNIYNKRVLKKAQVIVDCPDRPLFKEFASLPSGRRLMERLKGLQHCLCLKQKD